MRKIAILRGLQASHALEVADALVARGYSEIEVPLNREGAWEALEVLRHNRGVYRLGAGTLITKSQLFRAVELGLDFALAPNLDPELVKLSQQQDFEFIPGVQTVSEVYAAAKLGARWVKLFPASLITQPGLKDIKTVWPDGVKCIAVGGVNLENQAQWIRAGADGVGLGSSLFKDGALLPAS